MSLALSEIPRTGFQIVMSRPIQHLTTVTANSANNIVIPWLSTCMGDNPLALARIISHTGGQIGGQQVDNYGIIQLFYLQPKSMQTLPITGYLMLKLVMVVSLQIHCSVCG